MTYCTCFIFEFHIHLFFMVRVTKKLSLKNKLFNGHKKYVKDHGPFLCL